MRGLSRWTLATALILLAPSFQWAWGLSLSSLRSTTRLYLRDSATDVTAQRFSDVVLNGFINEGVSELQNRSWLQVGTTTFGLTAGTREYVLPSDYITTLRVTISNRALTQTTFQELDQNQTNWTVPTSTPTQYYINPFVAGTPPNVGFYPTPSTTSVNSVAIQYVQQPPTLVNDADVPFAGNAQFFPYEDAVADYAAYRGWLTLARGDLAQFYLALFNQKADEARANLNREPNYLPGSRGDRGPRQ